MPLDRYGVLRGTLSSHFRDDAENPGQWYHVHLRIAAVGQTFEAAVDVDSHNTATGVQWKSLRIPAAMIGPVPLPPAGFTSLASSAASGAIDCIRHPRLRTWRLFWFSPTWNYGVLPADRQWRWRFIYRPWRSGDFQQATAALEQILAVGAEIVVWGEPYPDGSPDQLPVRGVHNVHQNQGDPVGSPWFASSGTWQDGGVAVRGTDGYWQVFISKFSTQADKTDEAGHPL